MALTLRFFSGLSHFTTLARRFVTGSTPTHAATGGHANDACVEFNSASDVLTVNLTNFGVPSPVSGERGMACWWAQWPSAMPSNVIFARFMSTASVAHLNLHLNAAARIEVRLSVTIIATSAQTYAANEKNWYQWMVRIHDTLGEVKLRVHNDDFTVKEDIVVASGDTRNASTQLVNRFSVQGVGSNILRVSRPVVYVGTAAVLDAADFLPLKWSMEVLAADGFVTDEWNAGTNPAGLTDNNDGTTKTTTTPDAVLATSHAALSSTPAAIYGVQALVNAADLIDDGKNIAVSLVSDGAPVTSADQTLGVQSVFNYINVPANLDPDTGIAWTVAGVNAATIESMADPDLVGNTFTIAEQLIEVLRSVADAPAATVGGVRGRTARTSGRNWLRYG